MPVFVVELQNSFFTTGENICTTLTTAGVILTDITDTIVIMITVDAIIITTGSIDHTTVGIMAVLAGDDCVKEFG
jgi:hypothetical protein